MDTARICPACGQRTDSETCPVDSVATVEVSRAIGPAVRLAWGDVVGDRYEVVSELGQGGFGTVYLARHRGTRQLVALKLLGGEGELDTRDIRRFHREAEVTASLRHPNTVRVFDVGQSASGALYIAMEYVDGVTLADRIRARCQADDPFSEAEILDIALGILSSLSEAHERGLVHRDLKPGNVMLATVGGDQVVKVLDFGIVKTLDSDLTATASAVGTPAYMSPEQCMAEEVDARSDLYSLGVILYLLIANRPPFVDMNPMTIMFQHCSATPPPLPDVAVADVSRGLRDVVMRTLEKHPDARPASAQALRQELLELKHALREPGHNPVAATADYRALEQAARDARADSTAGVATTGATTVASAPRVGRGHGAAPVADAAVAQLPDGTSATPASTAQSQTHERGVAHPQQGVPRPEVADAIRAASAVLNNAQAVSSGTTVLPADGASRGIGTLGVAIVVGTILALGGGWWILQNGGESARNPTAVVRGRSPKVVSPEVPKLADAGAAPESTVERVALPTVDALNAASADVLPNTAADASKLDTSTPDASTPDASTPNAQPRAPRAGGARAPASPRVTRRATVARRRGVTGKDSRAKPGSPTPSTGVPASAIPAAAPTVPTAAVLPTESKPPAPAAPAAAASAPKPATKPPPTPAHEGPYVPD